MKILLIIMTLFTLPVYAKVNGIKVDIEHTPSARLMTLKGVLLEGVQWNQNLIKQELKKVNKIFSQCHIQISQLELLVFKSSANFSDLTEVAELGSKLEEMRFKSRGEVVMIFAGKLSGDLKAEGGSNTGGFSINELNLWGASKSELPMKNMAVLLDYAHTQKYKKSRNADYSPIAHELGHIFLNQGHSEVPNLMASPMNMVNAELTHVQCEVFRKSSLLK